MATNSQFESFPTHYHDADDEETIGSKIKRFFLPAGPVHSSASSATGSATLSNTTTVAASASPSEPLSSAVSTTAAPSEPQSSAPPTRLHSRNPSVTQTPLTSAAPPTRPQLSSAFAFPLTTPSALPSPTESTPPINRRTGRPIRLSGVSPSVLLTVAHSERGDLVQSVSSRSIYGDSRYGGDAVATPGFVHGSPTASDSFGAALANLSSIPGFPLGRDVGDDSKSIRSVSTVARPSASVAHVFRKLRGEVRILKDRSADEC